MRLRAIFPNRSSDAVEGPAERGVHAGSSLDHPRASWLKGIALSVWTLRRRERCGPPSFGYTRSVEDAFTLVEVILAISIAIGILMVALYLHSQVTNLRAQLLGESERIAAMRLVMDRLTSELRNAFAQPQYGFRGDATSVRFVATETLMRPASMAALWNRQTGPLTDLRLISYGVSKTMEGTNEVATGLIRTEQLLVERPETSSALTMPRSDESKLGTNSGPQAVSASDTNIVVQGPEPTTEAIRLLRFWYWDGSDWSETWESSDLPRAIEITLAAESWPKEASVADYPGEIFRRTVYLPTSREIESESTESGSSSNPPKP